MAVQDRGKPAITHFQVERKFKHYSLIRVQLETGRTHQIRVHLAHINHPLLGDPVYAGRAQVPAGMDPALEDVTRNFKRQALHAERLAFAHPRSRKTVEYVAPWPRDFAGLIEALERYD